MKGSNLSPRKNRIIYNCNLHGAILQRHHRIMENTQKGYYYYRTTNNDPHRGFIQDVPLSTFNLLPLSQHHENIA